MSDAKKTPNPLRWRESCPECGFILTDIEAQQVEGRGAFDCPRCQAHYTSEDFARETNEKHMAQHHRHAEADLSGEEPEAPTKICAACDCIIDADGCGCNPHDA